jgi:putative membrane protein
MELIRRLAVATAVNVAALAVTAWAFDGVGVDGWGALIFAGVVFGIVNTVVKPIVTVLALPLILLSLGVALFFVNMLMLALTDWVVNGLVIDGFWTLVGATLVVWLVNVLVESVFGVRGHARRKQGRRSPFRRRSS